MADERDAAGERGKDSKVFSYLKRRKTREGVPTPHLMEELSAPKVDVPVWSRSLAPFGFVLIMIALGVGCILLGGLPVGVMFMAIGVVPVALVCVLTLKALPRALGPHRDAGQEELGPYLGAGGDERVRQMSPGLVGEERDVMEWNRAEEADRTWRWLHEAGVAPERVETVSDDGTRLVGHAIVTHPESARWVVVAHGFAENWRAGLTFARRLSEGGCNLLLVDMRAHGESGGQWVGAGWLDRRDLVAWSRWVVGRAGAGARVALMGISMGAASALQAFGEPDLPEQVRACVADSAYADFWNAAVNAVSTGMLGTPPMPAHPIVDLARLFLRLRRGGYDLALARPLDAVGAARGPVLLVHATDDRICPVYMAERLAAAAPEGSELVTFPSAGHCCAVFADPGRYWDHVLAYLGARP